MPDNDHADVTDRVSLVFSDWSPLGHVEDPLHKDLSAVARIGNCLFVACDEAASVERLRHLDGGNFGDHRHFALAGLVALPAGPNGEMDIEGLCAEEVSSGSSGRTPSSARSRSARRTTPAQP